jgi:hypothetical protein
MDNPVSRTEWTVDDLARFLAGMPAIEESGFFYSGRQSQIWNDHAAYFDDLFDEFNALYATPFSKWAQVSLNGGRVQSTVFYPFSGPDFIFAHLLCPDASNYILCGLESCESTLEVGGSDPKNYFGVLKAAEASVSHLLKHSYFLTTDLRKHLLDSSMPGVLPILLILLARSGCHVNSVYNIHVPTATVSNGQFSALCIEFQHSRGEQKLFYFKQDLRDAFFSEESELFKFVTSFEKCAVFCKSSSYLLHEPNFSTIRNLILQQSSVLIQDPSSVPYRLLEQTGWDLNLHGCYRRTLPIFDKYEQPDLVRAYQNAATSAPLGFGIGYLTDPRSAALIVAARGDVGEDG